MKLLVVLGVLVAGGSSAAVSAERIEQYPPVIARYLRAGVTVEAFVQAVMRPLRATQTGYGLYDPLDAKPSDGDDPLKEYRLLGDGQNVTAAQVFDRALEVFRAVDVNADTVISEEEIARLGDQVPPAARVQGVSELCAFPVPSAKAETVLLGAYEGDADADVYLDGPYQETRSATVAIQPGSTPLYIVATSFESEIWVVSGATERVERLVVVAPTGARSSGVVGLPGERVSFAGEYEMPCIKSFDGHGPAMADAAKNFRQMVGRDADHVGGTYRLSSVSVPDMLFEDVAPRAPSRVAPANFDPENWKTALLFAPRGLLHFDPADVIASKPAKAYEVLPVSFGLSQLVHSGQLELLSPDPTRRFRIVRDIPHFPAGLAGSESVGFVLAKGVAMPKGDPGMSCVMDEETGEPLTQSDCRWEFPENSPKGGFKWWYGGLERRFGGDDRAPRAK